MSLPLHLHPVIVVNTDPGNDVDDDVACGWLLRCLLRLYDGKHAENSSQSTSSVVSESLLPRFHLIFVVQTYHSVCSLTNKTGASRLEDALVAFVGSNVLSMLMSKERKSAKNKNAPIVDILPPILLSYDLCGKIDLILNIAPNLDHIITKKHLSVVRILSHQGGYSKEDRGGAAFNEKNSCESLSFALANCGTRYIVTGATECMNHYRFSEGLFDKYEVPQSLRDLCMLEAFKMAVGRMNPVGNTAARFAQGLLVPGHQGKPGSNFILANELKKSALDNGFELLSLSHNDEKLLHLAVDWYVSTLEKSIKAYNIENNESYGFCPEVLNPSTKVNLLECERVLLQLGIPVVVRTNDAAMLICTDSADFEHISNEFHFMGASFQKVKNILPLTAAYDLIAAARLMNAFAEVN